ncbi:MAG: sulfurtransferase TusA family protein [Syntrophales bacterium]|nr:sulfurtransferase TusA family protein [Syntrophales bacterium]
MSTTIDARGLSCPQPVLVTLEAIAEGSADRLEISVDTDTAVENITRAVKSKGWAVSGVAEKDQCYVVTVVKE